jgi:hypothetical protein
MSAQPIHNITDVRPAGELRQFARMLYRGHCTFTAFDTGLLAGDIEDG